MEASHHAPPSAPVSGVIAEDPLRALPIGSEMKFVAQPFLCRAPSGLNWVNNWDFFDGAVVALHFRDIFGQRILGSGVLVAPGLALVARHVVEPEMNRVTSGGGFICTAIASCGLMIWRPRTVTLIPSSDLAILTLEYASTLPDMFRCAAVTTRLPRRGEQIFVVGLQQGPAGAFSQITFNMMIAVGRIAARYERGRDRVMIPWPTLEVDCPAVGGMSGGPAFDESGLLIGLLCSSLAGEPNVGPAYVSLLWPALSAEVNPCWGPVSLLDVDRRLCAIDRPEAVKSVRDDSGRLTQTIYHPWGD